MAGRIRWRRPGQHREQGVTMPLDDLFSALLRSGYGANPIDTQTPLSPVADALSDPSARLANGYAVNMNPPQVPKTVEEHQAIAAEAAHRAKIAKADADFAQAAAKARAAKTESTGGASTSSLQWPEMPNSFSMFQGPQNSPFTRLLAFQAQSVPQQDIKTSVDENGMATIKAPVDVLGQGLGMLRQYQSLIQSLDQQMQARDAELAAKEQFAKANPLLHALGLLSANIAQQPQMPGFVRALGATAGQLHAENDPIAAMVQAREALAPDGLYIATMFGGGTLGELRTVLADAEIERDGGLSPRIFPFADVRDAGALAEASKKLATYRDAMPWQKRIAERWRAELANP